MCDTILASPASTAGQTMLFGKNSDRQRNEAQAIQHVPGADHTPDERLTCTYITIPQARNTYAVLLCRPFWTWGAEMGANEHGVVIGNEGLHARTPAPAEPALIGMDIVRLALERGSTASESVNIITSLLEQHGQGGNCGHLTPAYYNNGFIVADAMEAYVVETVGREWLVERVNGVHASSNKYGIGSSPHRTSVGLQSLVRGSGWATELEPNYATAIGDPNREHIGHAGARRARGTMLLQMRDGKISFTDMIRILRDHGVPIPGASPWRVDVAAEHTLCMHAGGASRLGQTVGSMVSELGAKHAVHWVTGTSAPCISVFKPVLIEVPLPPHGPVPSDQFDPQSLWWAHEQLHRTVIRGDMVDFLAGIQDERDALEREFELRIKDVIAGGNKLERCRVVTDCWALAFEAELRWRTQVKPSAVEEDACYRSSWDDLNRLAGLDRILKS